MESTIEINKMSILIDKAKLRSPDSDIAVITGNLPLLDVPFIWIVDTVDWRGEENALASLDVITSLEVVDVRWSAKSDLQLFLTLDFQMEGLKWREMPEHLVKDIHLGEGSAIYVDNRRWDLISTLHKVLQAQKDSWPGALSRYLSSAIARASRKYFNSDLLPQLLEKLYFGMSEENDRAQVNLSFTASSEASHFASSDQYPPYTFFQIPTVDLEYFMNHFVSPKIQVKGYELQFQSLEVVGSNILNINVKEIGNDWDIKVDVVLDLRENVLYPSVRQIDIEGLDLLKRMLFQIFKGLLIRQIESRPLPFDKLFGDLKGRLEENFPFLKFMDGYRMTVQKLQLEMDMAEVLVHFEKAEVV